MGEQQSETKKSMKEELAIYTAAGLKVKIRIKSRQW
jgi:hypothetical protein